MGPAGWRHQQSGQERVELAKALIRAHAKPAKSRKAKEGKETDPKDGGTGNGSSAAEAA